MPEMNDMNINVETLDLGGDNFSLDKLLEEKQNEYNENTQQIKHKINYEAKSLIKKIPNRLSDEELKRKTELCIQLNRYANSSRFKDFLQSMSFNLSPTHLKSLSIVELEELLKQVQLVVSNKNSSKVVDEAYFMIIGLCENVSQTPKFKTHCDLQGLSQSLRNDPEIADLLECISLSYGSIVDIPPEKKLILSTLGCLIKTASVNKMLTKIKNYEQQLEKNVQSVSQNVTQNVDKENDVTPQLPFKENKDKSVKNKDTAFVINFENGGSSATENSN